jgi:hypothetical protein
MHTVVFAEQQKRLLFCPRPLSMEGSAKQYQGINELIHSGRAEAFQADSYALVLKKIFEYRENLIAGSYAKKANIEKTSEDVPLGLQNSSDAPGGGDGPLVDAITEKLDSAGLRDESHFERIIGAVKSKIFPPRNRS